MVYVLSLKINAIDLKVFTNSNTPAKRTSAKDGAEQKVVFHCGANY